MIKSVIFDLDDTMISEREYISSGYDHVSNFFANKYSLKEVEVRSMLEGLFIQSSKNVFNRLYEKFGIEYTMDDIKELVGVYRNHIPKIKLFDDVLPVLNIFKNNGVKLGIITDGYKETQLNKIEVLGLRSIFDYIIVTDELGREFWKPHERAYILMKEYMKVNYENMIYIGDNEEKDFISANKLGMKTVKINRGNGIYDEIKECHDTNKASIEIHSLREVLDIVGVEEV